MNVSSDLQIATKCWPCRYLVPLLLMLTQFGCGTMYSAVVEQQYPPRGEFLSLENLSFADRIDIHLSRCGEGPPLLYLHGNYGSVLDVLESPLYQRLCERFELIAFDRPGSGFSNRPPRLTLSIAEHAETVLALMDRLGIAESDIFAHSFGGAIALKLALQHPERIKKLYLIAPASYPWPGEKVFFKDRVVQYPFFGALFLETLFVPLAYLASESGYREVFHSEEPPKNYFKPARALAIRPQQFLNTARDTAILWDTLLRQSEQYPLLQQEIRVAHGTADTSVGLAIHSERLLQDAPHVQLFRIENAGHHPHFTHPEEVWQLFQE